MVITFQPGLVTPSPVYAPWLPLNDAGVEPPEPMNWTSTATTEPCDVPAKETAATAATAAMAAAVREEPRHIRENLENIIKASCSLGEPAKPPTDRMGRGPPRLAADNPENTLLNMANSEKEMTLLSPPTNRTTGKYGV